MMQNTMAVGGWEDEGVGKRLKGGKGKNHTWGKTTRS